MKSDEPTQGLHLAMSAEIREPGTEARRVAKRAGQRRRLLALMILTLAARAVFPGAAGAVPALAPRAGLPLGFEAIHSQAATEAQFISRSRSGTFLLSPGEAQITLRTAEVATQPPRARAAERLPNRRAQTHTIALRFVGANPRAPMTGLGPQSGKISYFLGRDPTNWRTNLPLFAKVSVAGVYPGVELVFYGNQQNLEYDFIVAPGADPGVLALEVAGADHIQVDPRGDLVLQVGDALFRQHKPLIHQIIHGVRKEVAGGYRLKDPQTVAFQVGHYDPRWPLIIDPVLTYATYLGGTGSDVGRDIALDGGGNIYVVGETLSANLSTTANAFQTNYAGGYPGAGGDVFIAKVDNTCSNLLYLTYLGGGGDDDAFAVALGADGSAFLTGLTDSRDFPLQSPLRPAITGTPSPYYGLLPVDAFVARIDPTGSALLYSTYLGGDTYDEGLGIAADSSGCAYVTGFTYSTNFLTTPNALQTNLAGTINAFVSKLNPAGNGFIYSTYLGGTNEDVGGSIAVDALGRAFVAGATLSTNFPVTSNALQPWLSGGQDAFVTVIGAEGTNLVWSTYLGGAGTDVASRLTLDKVGNPYLTGTESSSWIANGSFPITPGNLSPSGVFASANAGLVWSPSFAGLTHPQIGSLLVDPVSPARVYAGTGHGIARSSDSGATWETSIRSPATADGLAPTIAVGYVFALAVNPLNHSMLYAGTADGVYRSLDTGTNWSLSSTGLVSSYPGSQVVALALDPTTPSTLYAGTGAGVYWSTNAATNWVAVNNGLRSYNVQTLVIDPQTPATLYAGTDLGVYRSDNRGGSWMAFNNGLTSLFCKVLVFDPQNPSALFAGTTDGLFKTANRGTNWNRLPLGVDSTNTLSVSALAVDPLAPTTIYSGTSNGLFKSLDGGFTWNVVTNGISTSWIRSLALNPADPSRLYAGTIQSVIGSTSDAFLTKLDADSGSLAFSTILTGNGANNGYAVAVDEACTAYVVGATTSTNFPTAATSDSLSATNHGAKDVFVTAINADASALLYSVYLGGSADDLGYGVAVDPAGNAYIVGQTLSPDFPTNAASQLTLSGGAGRDAFLAKIAPSAPVLTALGDGTNLQLRWPAFAPEYTLERSPGLPAPGWTVVPQTPMIVNGWHTVTLPADGSGGFFRLRRH